MRSAQFQSPLQFIFSLTAGITILSTVVSSAIQYFAGNPLDLAHFALAVGMPIVLIPPTVLPLLRANNRLLQLRAELERQAHTDSLTGLPNRLAFFERMSAVFAAADGRTESIIVMMADIDQFKKINDNYGHDAGDCVLRHIGEQLQRVVMSKAARGDALVARIGGDEFAIVVSGLDRQQALDLAERICDSVRDTTCIHRDAPIAASLSIGIAMRAPGQDIATVLKAADIATYDAKALGRNRWCFMRKAGGSAALRSESDRPSVRARIRAA